MTKYRKKPVIIEAWKFEGSTTSLHVLTRWIETGVYERPAISTHDLGRVLEIPTLEGVMTATAGDYIIRGVQGEFYPCKSDIFKATYKAVDDE